MYFFVGLMTVAVLGLIFLGLWFEYRPLPKGQAAPRWLPLSVGGNLVLFVVAEISLLIMGLQDVAASEAELTEAKEITLGMGLALLGAGLPTGLAAIGAGIAIGPVGAAALAVIADKPEAFGRSLIYLGLAEGIAIYGLVVSILILGKV